MRVEREGADAADERRGGTDERGARHERERLAARLPGRQGDQLLCELPLIRLTKQQQRAEQRPKVRREPLPCVDGRSGFGRNGGGDGETCAGGAAATANLEVGKKRGRSALVGR